MKIGTMFLGKVETLGNESVQTKFFVFGVPLFPLKSVYVVGEDARGTLGFPLGELHATSVLAAYIRFVSGVAAFGVACMFCVGERSEPGSALAAVGILSALTWGLAMLVLGRMASKVSEQRRTQLALLGTGVPHELLDADGLAAFVKLGHKRFPNWQQEFASGRVPAGVEALYETLESASQTFLREHGKLAVTEPVSYEEDVLDAVDVWNDDVFRPSVSELAAA